jgi:hypothetical protein
MDSRVNGRDSTASRSRQAFLVSDGCDLLMRIMTPALWFRAYNLSKYFFLKKKTYLLP